MLKRTNDLEHLDRVDNDNAEHVADLNRDADRDDNDSDDRADPVADAAARVADQAARKFDETTAWLIANDPAMRAEIDEKRAQQHCQPLDESSIARAAKNRDNRARKRDRAPIGADRPKGEADRELLARGNFGGWPSASAFGSGLLSLDDPEQQQMALETLREYAAAQLAKIDRGCGGRPRGDVGKAQLLKIEKALALVRGGDTEKLQAVMKLFDQAKAEAKGKGGAA